MLTITKRGATLGPSVNGRTEKHGEEDVPACDITVNGIMLVAEEFNALLEDPRAHDAFYTKDATGFVQPQFPQIKPLVLAEKFEGARVALYVGLAPDVIELKDCKLAKVTLSLKAGGDTEMSLQIQATPSAEIIGKLCAQMNHDVSIELQDAKRAAKSAKQTDLPLSTEPAKEPPTHPEQPFHPKPGRRQPRKDMN